MWRNHSVLIVEDDQDICALLTDILDTYNISNFSANTLISAKMALLKYKPTHILLDYRLPDGTGKELIDYLVVKGTDTKIILSTGHMEEIEEADFLTFISNLIVKPFTKDSIIKALMV